MKMQIAARGIAKNPEWRLRASLLQFIARNFDCEVPDTADTPDPNERTVCAFYCAIILAFYARAGVFFFFFFVL